MVGVEGTGAVQGGNMTREEAIDIMEQRYTCMECVVSGYECDDCDTAFCMAIKALEQYKGET